MPEFCGDAALDPEGDAVVEDGLAPEFFGFADAGGCACGVWVAALDAVVDALGAAFAETAPVAAIPALDVSAAAVSEGAGLVADSGVMAEGSLSTGVAVCLVVA